jgi:hypothetical protein
VSRAAGLEKRRVCKDCPPGSRRPAPHPGPRCATHHRERKRAVSTAAHARRVVAFYGITPEQYQALLAAQGGRCWVCRRSTGARKRLAVEHDHRCTAGHPPELGCPQCITGLACGRCNQDVLGRLGRDPAIYEAIAAHLRQRPAQAVLSGMVST